MKNQTTNQIEIVEKGISFLVFTSNWLKRESIPIVFCHKDRNGDFQNGLTSEGILLVLISRHQHLVNKDSSTENVKALLFLQQAYEAIKNRRAYKRLAKDEYKRNGLSVQAGSEPGR